MQEAHQRRALPFREHRRRDAIVDVDVGERAVDEVLPGGRQAQLRRSAGRSRHAPPDQALALEKTDDLRHVGALDAERPGERCPVGCRDSLR